MAAVDAAKVQRVAGSRWVDRLARGGLVAKGAVYALIALLALRVALGDQGQSADQEGAIRTVAQQPFGRWVVALLAAGLAGYAVWRLAQTVIGPEGETGLKAWAYRLSFGVRAIVYGLFSVRAVQLIAGSGPGTDEDSATAALLAMPGGQFLVLIAGLVFLAIGVRQATRTLSGDADGEVEDSRLSSPQERWLLRLSAVGHLARGVVFGLVGLFLGRAALTFDPDEAVGFDGALREIAEGPFGVAMLVVVAAGLACYAAYTLALAARGRPRSIN